MNTARIRKLLVGTPRMTPYGWEIDSLVTGEVYTIELNRWRRWQCSCPSGRGCKHIRALERLLTEEADTFPICT